MMRSLFAGVSGLQNHQTRMDVIGNNISNVNTTGFKKGRVNFEDMISQTLSGAAKPNEDVGGINPKQVGLGMMVASIDTIHTQGALQTTGVNTDLAIQGSGFFIMKDGQKTFYTRDGAFSLDRDGTLVNPANGLKVQGWTAQTVNGEQLLRTAADPGDLLIPVGSKDPARATQEVFFASNLDKRTPILGANATEADRIKNTWEVDKTIYDSFGNTHRLVLNFSRDPNAPDVANQWQVALQIDPPEQGQAAGFNNQLNVGGAAAAGAAPVNTFTIRFSNLGTMEQVNVPGQANPINGAQTRVQVPVQFLVQGTNPVAGGQPNTQIQNFNLDLGQIGSYTNSVTQYAEQFTTKSYAQDGYPMGYMENFQIDQSGVITGVFSNGTKRALGQVALASFTNPGGLEKNGENYFVKTNNSGDPNVGTVGQAGKGKLLAGTLEMSNVDLAETFADMIVTERGFQANSKSITTSDQMLQELLNLKR